MRIPEEIVEEIFEIIKKENNLQKDKNIISYFSSLNRNLAELRRGYKNNFVKIDYKDKKNQEVYLIAYFPLYTKPIVEVLEYINKEHSSLNIPHNLCLIGAGPAPEILGFLKFINNQLNNDIHDTNIIIELIEIASEWNYARSIIKRVYKKTILKNLTKFSYSKLKIYKNDVSKIISNSSYLLKRLRLNPYKRVVVIQNIINEIEQHSLDVFIENVIKCYKNLAAGSFLILIDLNYDIVPNVAEKIESILKKDVIKSFCKEGGYFECRAYINLPEIIETYLFEGFYAKRKVIYGCSIFYKRK